MNFEMKLDKRYQVVPTWCGHPEKWYVVYFCGEYLGAYRNEIDATQKAIDHKRGLLA